MRKQDKQRPKPRGVWVELQDDGNVWFIPVRMTRHCAVDLMRKSVRALEDVKGLTKQ